MAWRTALTAGSFPPTTHPHYIIANMSLTHHSLPTKTNTLTDAKLAFAGDEGAGIQMDIEGGVYAEEERWYFARVWDRRESA